MRPIQQCSSDKTENGELNIFFSDCPSSAFTVEENCVGVFPFANLDPNQPGEAQIFCQVNMIEDGKVLINSSGITIKIKLYLTLMNLALPTILPHLGYFWSSYLAINVQWYFPFKAGER